MNTRAFATILGAIVLAGCASPAQFNNFVNVVSDPVVVKTETFDGSTSVQMRDRALPVIGGGDATMAYGLSANWNSAQPQQVRLQFLESFEVRSGGAAISSPFANQWEPANGILEILIIADGKRSAWKPKGFDATSGANPQAMADIGIITVPLEELRQLVAAKELKMRVKTVGATLDRDIDFSVKHELLGKELASAVLPRYVAKIEELRHESRNGVARTVVATPPLAGTTEALRRRSNASAIDDPVSEIVVRSLDETSPCDEKEEYQKEYDKQNDASKMVGRKPPQGIYRCTHIFPIDKAIAKNSTEEFLRDKKGGKTMAIQIRGRFNGWPTRQTDITLTNGEVWRQTEGGSIPAIDSVNAKASLRTQAYSGHKIGVVMHITGYRRDMSVERVK